MIGLDFRCLNYLSVLKTKGLINPKYFRMLEEELKKVKLKYHREIPKDYKIKSVTLTNSNGNYYVSVLTEFEKKFKKYQVMIK